MSNTRDTILQKIRQALDVNPILPKQINRDTESFVFTDSREVDRKLLFAEQLTAVGGKFVYCEHTEDLIRSLNTLLQTQEKSMKIFCPHEELRLGLLNEVNQQLVNQAEEAHIAITTCQYLIARTGSVVVNDKSNQLSSIAAPIHIVIANDQQLVFDLEEILVPEISTKSAVVSIITGPSRTADIEKTLVIGVHGTKELFVFLVQSPHNE